MSHLPNIASDLFQGFSQWNRLESFKTLTVGDPLPPTLLAIRTFAKLSR